MELSRWILKIEASLLIFGLVAAGLPDGLNRMARPLFWAAAVVGIGYAGQRYWMTWPMTPMFAGSILYPPLLAILGVPSLHGSDRSAVKVVLRWLIACSLIAVLAGVYFPKDFYLPIIKTTSIYAHGVILFGSFGRACFLIAGGWGCAALCGHDNVMQRMFRWIVWGFGFWTLSLFSGEVWSYSGWGVPMVWEDASTLAAIATWLFYIGVIHLHLGGLWSRNARAAMSVMGAALVLVLNGYPDMGPFRPLLFTGLFAW